MLKKENKIFVAVCPDVRTRRQMISRLAVRLGFALIPSDAAKLIQEDLYSCDLSTAYFVMCAQYILALVDRHDFHGTFSCARKIYFAIINFIFLQMFNISDKIK